MIARELIKELNDGAPTPENTCDTVKHGDDRREIKRVAVCMMGTADVIRAAREWGRICLSCTSLCITTIWTLNAVIP